MTAQKKPSSTKKPGRPVDGTLDDLYQLARTQVEDRQGGGKPSRRRWSAMLILEIIACLVLGALALRWYRAGSQSPLQPASLAFIAAAHRSAAQFSPAQALAMQAEPTATSVPPTPVIVVGPSGIPGLDPKVFIPMVWRGPGGCKSAEEIQFELVSGPILDPLEGTHLKTAEPPAATATWTIRNLSECQWDSLGIYSVYSSLLEQPRIRRGGDLFDPVAGLVVANPGETLEVSTTFPGDQASEVSDEWILVINGHQLFSKSHLLLDIDEWLVVENPEPKNTGTGNAGTGGTTPGQASPIKQPQRPTESAPVRP